MRPMRTGPEKLGIAFITSILLLAIEQRLGVGVAAECAVSSCFVQDLRIVECRPASVSKAPVMRSRGVSRHRARRVLGGSGAIFVRVAVQSSGPEVCHAWTGAAHGSEARPMVNDESWFLVLVPSCAAYAPGAMVRRFASSPCCDTVPPEEPECLFHVRTLQEVPSWVSSTVNPEN